MVGAPSSNRCGTCKRRKVKCDEAWPICGPCKKGHRVCPGPPKRQIKFVEDGSEQQELPIRSADQAPWKHHPQALESDRPGQYGSARNLQMITLRSTAKDGGTFQKIRLFNVSRHGSSNMQRGEDHFYMARSPNFSPNESLAQRLYAFLDSGDHGAGANVHIHGMWLRELPRRLGSSAALDSAVSCLVTSHESVVRQEAHSKWLNQDQYGRALQALQKAVDDPQQQFATDTLASIAVMWRIEGIFAAASGSVGRQAVHARALTYMLKARGYRNMSDKLEFLLTLDCQIAAVQNALAAELPEPCMFDSEEWDLIFEEPHGRSDLSMLYWKVFREFVRWPGLIHDILQLYLCPENAPATLLEIAQRALVVAQNLEAVGLALEDALQDPKICVTKPSSTGDPLVPLVFEFRDTEAAPVLGYYCFFTIVMNRMLIHLSSLLSGEANADHLGRPLTVTDNLPTTFPISEEHNIPSRLFTRSSPLPLPLSHPICNLLRFRNVQLAQTIWMIYEQARTWKPMGCLFFINALKASYSWAGSPEMKAWILNVAADVEDFLPHRTPWDLEKLDRMTRAMSGEIQAIGETIVKKEGF